ncbi:MAG: hypothetical protein N2376_12730 [Clostridia bacterium]|nr:hypothetical protein [Clostridia bacterium]
MLAKIVMMSMVVAVFILIDLFPMAKEKAWKEFALYLGLMAAVLVLGALVALDVKLPSPAEPLKKAVSFIWGLK